MAYASHFDHGSCEHEDEDADTAACDMDSLIEMLDGNADHQLLARLRKAWERLKEPDAVRSSAEAKKESERR